MMVETISPTRVAWNPANKKEVDEAKKVYISAKRSGKQILKPVERNGKEERIPVSKWTELSDEFIMDVPLKEGEVFMRILDESGDKRIIWNSNDPEQVKDAAKLFAEFLSKGWRAYAIGADGKQGKRIRAFSAETEEIFFEESSLATKLKDFVKQFPTIEVGAKTRPA